MRTTVTVWITVDVRSFVTGWTTVATRSLVTVRVSVATCLTVAPRPWTVTTTRWYTGRYRTIRRVTTVVPVGPGTVVLCSTVTGLARMRRTIGTCSTTVPPWPGTVTTFVNVVVSRT